jgi:hypothetical protein
MDPVQLDTSDISLEAYETWLHQLETLHDKVYDQMVYWMKGDFVDIMIQLHQLDLFLFYQDLAEATYEQCFQFPPDEHKVWPFYSQWLQPFWETYCKMVHRWMWDPPPFSASAKRYETRVYRTVAQLRATPNRVLRVLRENVHERGQARYALLRRILQHLADLPRKDVYWNYLQQACEIFIDDSSLPT